MFNKNHTKNGTHKNDINTINHLQANTTVQGNIESKGNIRIDGHIIGDLVSNNKIVLGPTSIIEGNVTGKNLDIAGKITGRIIAHEGTILQASACVNGDISTNDLITESGAIINGLCTMANKNDKSTKLNTM